MLEERCAGHEAKIPLRGESRHMDPASFAALILLAQSPIGGAAVSTHFYSRVYNADDGYSVNLPRPGKPVHADHAAGNGGDSDPSTAGVNLGYPRLEVGAVGVAPWQQ